MESGIQLIFDLSEVTTYPEQTAGASEHLVRTSQSQDSEKDLGETEVPSFEKYFGYLGNSKKKIDLNGLSTKMLRECYQATEDLTSLPFSLNWTNWGTMQSGKFLTRRILEFRKTGSECTLSDILEAEVESKYFLSKEQTEKIVLK